MGLLILWISGTVFFLTNSRVSMVCSCVFGLGRDFRTEPVVSIQTQAVKFHKNFVHFKYSLRKKKKNILGEYLRSLSQVPGTIYTSNE